MKVIDLLNKIAKEKKYPKIKFNNSIYEYHDKEHGYCRYYHDNTYICLNTEYYLFDILNDEVEILEEPKGIPKKIDIIGWDKCIYGVTTKEKELAIEIKKTQKLLNQVLDYLKSKRND